MKKNLLLFLLFPLLALAQNPETAHRAVVKVATFTAHGDTLHTTYGYFQAQTGRVVTLFSAFKGAVRATVTDWKGHTHAVTRIAGASANYDMAVVQTDAPTKSTVGLTAAPTPTERGTTGLLQACYSTRKNDRPEPTAIATVEPSETFRYYTFTTPNEERFFGCPVVDAQGRAVAMVQRNVIKNAITACGMDAALADSLRVKSTSAFNADLNAIGIAKLLPDHREEAYSYVYMLVRSSVDSTLIATALADFMHAWPDYAPIYADAAVFHAGRGNYARADELLQKGIALNDDNRATLYDTQSALMYHKVTSRPADVYPTWTLETALKAAEAAYAVQPSPSYLLQQATVLSALRRDREALEKYQSVNASPLASSRTFLYAANALERIGGKSDSIVALLDSAVARCAKPYGADAAEPLFARAKILTAVQAYRRAVADYNEYEKIVGPRRLSAYFYYLRSRVEKECRMYQQALDDLETAASMAQTPDEGDSYRVEKALLYLNVNLLDEAIAQAQEIVRRLPRNADAHKILGVAYGEKKQKNKAVEHLRTAVELGDENAAKLLEKYK